MQYAALDETWKTCIRRGLGSVVSREYIDTIQESVVSREYISLYTTNLFCTQNLAEVLFSHVLRVRGTG